MHMQKVELTLLYESSTSAISSRKNEENQKPKSPIMTTQLWDSEHIQEFVRKLGFLDKDNAQGYNFKTFLNQSKVSYILSSEFCYPNVI